MSSLVAACCIGVTKSGKCNAAVCGVRVIRDHPFVSSTIVHTRGLFVLSGLNRELKLSASTTAWMISSSSSTTTFSFAAAFGGIAIV